MNIWSNKNRALWLLTNLLLSQTVKRIHLTFSWSIAGRNGKSHWRGLSDQMTTHTVVSRRELTSASHSLTQREQHESEDHSSFRGTCSSLILWKCDRCMSSHCLTFVGSSRSLLAVFSQSFNSFAYLVRYVINLRELFDNRSVHYRQELEGFWTRCSIEVWLASVEILPFSTDRINICLHPLCVSLPIDRSQHVVWTNRFCFWFFHWTESSLFNWYRSREVSLGNQWRMVKRRPKRSCLLVSKSKLHVRYCYLSAFVNRFRAMSITTTLFVLKIVISYPLLK